MLLGVDVGGTFTDAVLVADGRRAHGQGADDARRPVARRHGRRRARAGRARARSASDVEGFAHGMTVATNALLEGTVARTAFVATDGFTDVVALGRQARRELYRLCAAHPAPLTPPERRFAARERTGPDGVLEPLSRPRRRSSTRWRGAEPEAVAVCLLHSYRHPEHERAIGDALRERLGVHVSLSHEVVGTFREFERAATTEVDAALSPLLARYLRRLLDAVARRRACPTPAIMQSSGGLAGARRRRRPRRAHGAQRPGRRRGRGGAARRALRRARPAVLRHGRHLVRRVRRRGRPRARDDGARGRRPAAGPADGRHPHRRRRRRLDRLARPRRRAARGPAQRGRRAGTGVLRARRHRADGDRRQPRPRPPERRRPAGRRRRRSTPTRRTRPSSGWPASWGSTSARAPRASCASPTPRWSARCA